MTPVGTYTEDALVEQPAIALLPKLVSGEVDVSELEIAAPKESRT